MPIAIQGPPKDETDAAIDQWEARGPTRRCSWCRNAKVRRQGSEVITFCAAGHGEEIVHISFLQKHQPGFSNAAYCPDWESNAD